MPKDIATRVASNIQETRIQKKFTTYKTSNSGAGKFQKSDLYIPGILAIECKTCMTPKSSFSIKKEWIEKGKEEAFANRLSHHVIAFNFDYQDSNDYYVIDDKLMRYLVDKLREDYNNGNI